MARFIYQGTFKDQNGAVVGSSTTSDGNPGTVTVYLAGTDTLASVYTASVGGTAVNSVSTDAYGYFYFWVDDTTYTIDQEFKIVLTHPDFLTRTYDNIYIIGLSTTYLQAFVNANPPDINFTQTGTGAITRTIQEKAKEIFAVSDFPSFAESVTALETAGGGTLSITASTSVIDDLIIPATIKLNVEKGSLINIASGKSLSILGNLEAGLHQVFTGSGTVTFGTLNANLNHDTVTEIHPEWWGTFPNGTDDTDVLNKAIAASKIVDDAYSGMGMGRIVIGAGIYYIRPGDISLISTSFYAPEAIFKPTEEVTSGLILLPFGFVPSSIPKKITIGGIWGLTAWDAGATTHYHMGIAILTGDSAAFEIGALVGLKVGMALTGNGANAHIGIHKINIKSIIGCDTGVYFQPGQIDGANISTYCNEGNIVNIEYATRCGYAVYMYSAASGDALVFGNTVNISCLELNGLPLDTVSGFYLDGPMVQCNTFIVRGGLVPPPSVGSYILNIDNGPAENLFELAYFDLDKIALADDAGYNVFRQDSVSNSAYPALYSNSFGRSTIMSSAAPTIGPWRVGDKCWNSTPTPGGVMGWVCTTSGATGAMVWKSFGTIAS